MMNLTSVKYQDSCIYIGLIGSYEQGTEDKFLGEIKNLYAVYKIKAHDNYVRDTILVRRQDLTTLRGEIIVKFELNKLHRPDECEIEIVSLKFIFQSGEREELNVNQSYPFVDIRAISPMVASKERASTKRRIEDKRRKSLSIRQEIVLPPFETAEKKNPTVKELPAKNRDLKRQEKIPEIEKITPPSLVVSEVEANIERKMDAHTKKLEIDIKRLCYETLDSLLTSLPQPELAEEYRASNIMVKSIRRYINDDLLQKETEEGESA